MGVRELARRLPYPIKQGLKYIYGSIPPRFRYGKVFWKTYNFLQESQWWSREKLEDYQMQQLSKLFHHAYENVPYYRRVFDERGLKPKDIDNFDDLKKLPYLTKEFIRDNLPELLAQNYPKSKLQYVTTGGSTGIPLGFYHEKGVSNAKEYAFMFTQWKRVGFKMGDKRVVLRSGVIQSASKNKFWEYNPIDRVLNLSPFHMTDDTLPKYIKKIKDFRPDYLHVLPSTFSILARFMKDHNIEPFPTVKALLCGSENIYPWQRQVFEDTFQCRIYSWYGHSEMAVLAGECENSSNYHIFPEYGAVELIDNNGKPIEEEEVRGEIVATGFNNYAMPFIRYRTGDIAVYSKQECSCGRNYPMLKKIEGRIQELIVLKDGTYIPATVFLQHFEAFNNIKEMQIIQEKAGIVIVNIIKRPKYSKIDEQEILSYVQKGIGDRLDIEFAYVDNISRFKSGKYKFLIQKLPIKFRNP